MKKNIILLVFFAISHCLSFAQNLSRTTIYFDWDSTIFNMYNNDFWRMKDPSNFNRNYFLEDIKESISQDGTILEEKKYDFRGPSFANFQQAMLTKKISEITYILTARGHHPNNIYQGLLYLKELGLINYTVPLKNIIPVNHESIKNKYPDGTRGDQIKGLVLQQKILDYKKEDNFSGKNYRVVFFDDDVKNIKSTLAAFKEVAVEDNVDMLIIYRNSKRTPRDKLPEYIKLIGTGENQGLLKEEMNSYLFCPSFCL
jgi:hypothetical protein